MKTVRSLAHATKTAAQMGAPLEVGGRVINSGGATLSVLKPAEKALPMAPTPTPAPALDLTEVKVVMQDQARLAGEQGDRLAGMLTQMLSALAQQPRSTPATPTPARPVAFNVERDERGLLTKIIPVYASQRVSA